MGTWTLFENDFCLLVRRLLQGYKLFHTQLTKKQTYQSVAFIMADIINFQIRGMNRDLILKKLNTLCVPAVGLTFAHKNASNGSFELPVLLYESCEYPRGFIAVVRFMWYKTRYFFHNSLTWVIHHPPANFFTIYLWFIDIKEQWVLHFEVRKLRVLRLALSLIMFHFLHLCPVKKSL